MNEVQLRTLRQLAFNLHQVGGAEAENQERLRRWWSRRHENPSTRQYVRGLIDNLRYWRKAYDDALRTLTADVNGWIAG